MSQNRPLLPFGSVILATASLSIVGATPADTGVRPSPEGLSQPCLACHAGHEGSVIPSLLGQSEAQIVSKMREFRYRDVNSVMHRIARGYRDEDDVALARYFSRRAPGSCQ